VAQLRERFRDELALREREGRLHSCFFGETALCRVLRGNNGELERSAAWFERFLEKTIEYGVDDLVSEILSKMKAGSPPDETILPYYEEVQQYFRFTFRAPKCSAEGDLVQYMPFIDQDKYGILEGLDWDYWVRFSRSCIVLLCLILEQMSCTQRRMVKCVIVVDLADCGMDNILCSTFDHANDRDVSKMLEEVASEIISEVYVVNAPWTVTTLFNTFKIFIPSKFSAKFTFPSGDGLQDPRFVDRAGGKEQLQHLYSSRVGLVSQANRSIGPTYELDSMPSEKEMHQISKLKERFAEAFSAREKAGLLHPCFFGDLAIARVLRGNDGSLSMAIKWFQRFLEKANQYGIDRHYEHVIKKLDASGSQYGNLTMLAYYDEVKDYCRMVFTAPRPTPKGDVVQYIAFADVDRQGILDNVDWSHWVAFMRSYMILRCIEAERLSQLRGRMVRCISIFDLEDSGIGLKGLPSVPDFDERQSRDVFEFMQNICAEILGHNYVLNAPWVMVKAYNWFRNFVPEKLSRKLQLMDGDGRSDPEFLRSVGSEAQLKQLLGTRVGLTIGQKDEPSGEKDIPPGHEFQKSREVAAGQRISWSCEVLPSFADGLLGPSSVEFGVTAYWLGEDLGSGDQLERSPVEEIIPPQVMDARRGRISGSCRSTGNGVITLQWSNYNSLMRTKAVRYSVSVADGNGCDDYLDSKATSSSAPWSVKRSHAEDAGPLYQYYRFTPTKMRGGSRASNFSHLCAIHFRSQGAALCMSAVTVTNPGGACLPGDWPEQLVDGKLSTKWADLRRGAIVLMFPTPVHVDEIGFTTAGDLPECDPVRWLLEGSLNEAAWTLLHSQAVDFPMPVGRLTASLWLRLAGAGGGREGEGGGAARRCRPLGNSFQAFRFTPTRLRTDESDRVQVSELRFRTTTGSVISLDNATVSNPGGLCDKGYGPKRIVDGNKQTCWSDGNKMSIVVQFPQYMRLEEFSFNTAQDRPECDPIHWRLEGVRVGGTWTLLISSTDEYSVPTRRSSSTVWFSMIPSRETGSSDRRCSHIWVTPEQFEQRLRGASFLSWDDFCSAAGPSAVSPFVPERLHGLLWIAAFLANVPIWCLLAAAGTRGWPAASLAATAAYCAALYAASLRGWLPISCQRLALCLRA